MEEAIATRYWCHMCSQTVDPVMEAEIKCPFCQSGFVEEMEHQQDNAADNRANQSLWAPILMEMMNDPVRRRRNRSVESVEDNQNETEAENETTGNGRETDLDWQLQEILRRRRRHSHAVLQLLQGIRAGLTLESETNGDGNNTNNSARDRERVILINPFNQTITVQSSVGVDSVPGGSLGDYFIGPGLEMLIQRLAENDPNRYGTPPAQKEAIEALATVKIEESLQCSVCLDDFEFGTEAKQMPCKHNFHGDCLLPWLELHSSCPVCRYQLPADEVPKTDSVTTETNGNNEASNASVTSSHVTENRDGNRRDEEEAEEEEEEENDDSDGSGFSIPWPFSSFFSSSQDSNASRGSN